MTIRQGFLCLLVFLTVLGRTHGSDDVPHYGNVCTPHSMSEFPRDIFSQEQRVKGAVLVHLLACLYLFWAVTVVCDDYFVPSLAVICDKMHLTSDVAGATFMAIGGSAPEFLSSFIGVFITNGDIGVGTIVGSAVLNIFFVIGICGLLAKKSLVLSPWPLARDFTFYAICILILTIILSDFYIHWYEALTLLLVYVTYLLLMWKNRHVEKACTDFFTWLFRIKQSFPGEEQDLLLQEPHQTILSEEMKEEGPTMKDITFLPEGSFNRLVFVLGWPMRAAFLFTVPNPIRYPRLYMVTFSICIVWIGVLTYILIWMVTVIGYTLNVPDTVMGLTLVAFGSSIPDTVSSVIVARKGDGDMAVAHTVGSNVFDVLICLGLPWFLGTVFYHNRKPIRLYSQGMFFSNFLILGALLITMVLLASSRWKLNRVNGSIMLIFFTTFIIISCLMELNVLGPLNPPVCPYLS